MLRIYGSVFIACSIWLCRHYTVIWEGNTQKWDHSTWPLIAQLGPTQHSRDIQQKKIQCSTEELHWYVLACRTNDWLCLPLSLSSYLSPFCSQRVLCADLTCGFATGGRFWRPYNVRKHWWTAQTCVVCVLCLLACSSPCCSLCWQYLTQSPSVRVRCVVDILRSLSNVMCPCAQVANLVLCGSISILHASVSPRPVWIWWTCVFLYYF